MFRKTMANRVVMQMSLYAVSVSMSNGAYPMSAPPENVPLVPDRNVGDRDRLVAKKVQKKLIRQAAGAIEAWITVAPCKAACCGRLKAEGDKAVVHGLRGRRSNRKSSEETKWYHRPANRQGSG